MTRQLVAMILVLSTTSWLYGQNGFGSRSSSLGNSGGFATTPGLANGAVGSSNFNTGATPGFSNNGGFANGSNARMPYSFGGAGAYGSASYVPPAVLGGNVLSASNYSSNNNSYFGTNNNNGLSVDPNGNYSANGTYGNNDLTGAIGNAIMPNGYGLNGLGFGTNNYGGFAGVPGFVVDPQALGINTPSVNVGGLQISPQVAIPFPGAVANAALSTSSVSSSGIANSGPGMGSQSSPSVRKAMRPPLLPQSQPEQATEPAPQLVKSVPTQTAIGLRIQERLARMNSEADFRNIKVLMSDDTAVLRGTVKSKVEEQWAVRLVSLEPGVATVISQLTIQGTAK